MPFGHSHFNKVRFIVIQDLIEKKDQNSGILSEDLWCSDSFVYEQSFEPILKVLTILFDWLITVNKE